MGRGRGKGKKQTTVSARNDTGNDEEEKILASKRRGRRQKPLNHEVEEDKPIDKIENGDENAKSLITRKTSEDHKFAAENGTKRRKVNSDLIKEENDSGDNLIKPVGFRQNRSRRKSKPRRAAEVGVECN